jgi:tetratricopeptide (TPR) repeat protein
VAFLKAFNPHELPARTVLGVATGREDPLDRILSIVRDNLNAPTPQHVIVSAPRGYGKSFFLRYVQIKIEEMARTESLPVAMALLPEELPHVKEPETLLAEIRRTFLGQPADTIGVSWVEDDGQQWDRQVVELDAAIVERFGDGQGLLVAAVENFDLLLRKAFAKPVQASRLREWLTRRGNRLMLIAASARGAFDSNYDRPLFKAFEEMSFEPWTIEQSLMFFKAQRAAAGKAPLTEVQEARAKSVATFIGGTPRLATLIGEALLDDDPLGAADVLEKLVDELTPYYKERIEVLPARSQALLDALLRGGENCSATELARRVGAPSQPAIAAALDELKKDLLVTGSKAPDSAEVLLRVTDRVFAHYYRKRILSHGLEICPLEALVDLLAVIYSPAEKKREADKFASLGLTREAQVFERLWVADQSRLEKSSVDEAMAEQSTDFKDLISAWERMAHEGRYSEGLDYLDRALVLVRAATDTAKEAEALGGRAWTLGQLGRHDEALATARDAASKAESAGDIREQARALRQVAWTLGELDRHDEAVTTAREAASKAESAGDLHAQARALETMAWSLGQLGLHDKAIAIAREASSKAASEGDVLVQVEALRSVARSLGKLGRHDEAIAAARQAAGFAEEFSDRKVSLAVARTILLHRPGKIDADLAYRSYDHMTQHGDAEDLHLFFSSIADTATRTLSWPRLITTLTGRPDGAEVIVNSSYRLSEPGSVVAGTFLDRERDDAFKMLRHFASALAQAIDAASDPRLTRLWSAVVEASAEAIATTVEDGVFLNEAADILAEHASIPARATALLSAAAAYHAAGRDPAALARLDPDLATTLMAVFAPSAEAPKLRHPKGRKPRASKTKR